MNLNVLIIEDDNFLSELLLRKLSGSPFHVQRAQDGDTGLLLLEKSQPSLVLLDLMLPKKSGFEILTYMQKSPVLKYVPVIVFSNLSDNASIERATSLGARAYLVKSNFTLDELLMKMGEVIEGHIGTNSFFKNLTG
jgi:DNA-binding response OmpR family regulator